MNRFSESEISKQEALTTKRLSDISAPFLSYETRPKESLVGLMHWAKKVLIGDGDSSQWQCYIHNKISMDGSFMQFCEENRVALDPVHSDAITSWKADNTDDEHFVAVGMFQITTKDLAFYHCSLFHKGNQNEDEVSYFSVVNNNELEKYLNFRNKYAEWEKKRDRESLEIEVIGGNPIPYTLDPDWNSLFLPEDLRQRIITRVDGFLNSKEIYQKLGVPWRSSFGMWGPRGNGKTSCLRVIMAQYPQLKPVTIQPGHSSPDEILGEAFEYAAEHAPSLLFFEDLQELIGTVDMRHLLQLLDGLQKLDGILTIVTGNDFSNLEQNLKSRPRRFDAFFEFPLPDVEQCKKYLAKHFADIVSDTKIEQMAKTAVKKKFTYAHLQEVYFNAVFIAIPEGREVPNESDIDLSLTQVIAEKNSADADFTEEKRDLTDDVEEESEGL